MGNKAGGRWVPQGPLRFAQTCPKASPQPHPGVLRGGSSAHPEPALPREGQSWAGSRGQHPGLGSGSGRAPKGGPAQANKAQRAQRPLLPQPGALVLVALC